MNMYIRYTLPVLLLLSACSLPGENAAALKRPEILTIYPDGKMSLMGRPVAAEDIVIYPDGFGGERAAIKVRLEPLRPEFYRDTIIVHRINAEEMDN